MLQIIEYKQTEAFITVGFRKYNFVVYGTMGIIEEYTKEQYLQKLYEQCKNAIDYEAERYLAGKSNSITTNLEGEEFIPELPKIKIITLTTDTHYVQFEEEQHEITIELGTTLYDQYGENIEGDVILEADYGSIENSILTIPRVQTSLTINITARANELSAEQTIDVQPYTKPASEAPSHIDNINMALLTLSLKNL